MQAIILLMSNRTDAMCERGDGPMRDQRGRLLPGHSGNPKGRPPVDETAAAVAKVVTLARRQGQRVTLILDPAPEPPRAA